MQQKQKSLGNEWKRSWAALACKWLPQTRWEQTRRSQPPQTISRASKLWWLLLAANQDHYAVDEAHLLAKYLKLPSKMPSLTSIHLLSLLLLQLLMLSQLMSMMFYCCRRRRLLVMATKQNNNNNHNHNHNHGCNSNSNSNRNHRHHIIWRSSNNHIILLYHHHHSYPNQHSESNSNNAS